MFYGRTGCSTLPAAYTLNMYIVGRRGCTLLFHITNLKSTCISSGLDHGIALVMNLVNNDTTALVA